MSTTKPENTAKAAETEKVQLIKPHTHGGNDHPEGAELVVDKATAEWLRKAKVVAAEQAAEAPAAKA